MQKTGKYLHLLELVAYGCIGVLAYLLCIHFIGVESMRYSDEVTHARVIQEGIDSGTWLRLTLDGVPYYNKPPFKMWLTRLVVALLGEGNLQYRLIDGLATMGTIIVTMLLAFRLFGSHLTAALSGLLLLGSWDFLVESRNNQGTQDALLLFFVTSSMLIGWCLLQHVQVADHRAVRRSVVGLSVALGLAISTKSLAGGLPILLLLIALITTLRSSFLTFLITHWKILLLGALLVITIPGLYYIPLFLREPNAWGHAFHGEIYNRLLGEGYHNQERWDFYLHGIFVRRPTFPTALVLLGGVVAFVHIWRGRDRMAWNFILVWTILPLVLYSMFSSRVFHYIAPVFPPLAILSARGLSWSTTAAFESMRGRSLLMTTTLGMGVTLALLPCYYLVASELQHALHAVSTSGKKIDIEGIVTEIQSASRHDPIRVVLFDMAGFLGETGNQAWRFKFYLHLVRDQLQHESQMAQVAHEVSLPSPLWVLAPIEYTNELRALSLPCEVRPFAHPSGKRSHYRSNEIRRGLGKPQFVLIRYRCTEGGEKAREVSKRDSRISL